MDTTPFISAGPDDKKTDMRVLEEVVSPDRTREWVEQARAGDEEAFGELYKQHYGSVFRLARFYLPQAEAEDAAAEAFVRAWKAIPRYRDTGAPFTSWLYGIARHVVFDTLRARKRVEPRAELPEDFAEHVDHTVRRLDLAAAMSELPDEQRRVLEMKFLMGLGNTEVAAALGKTKGAVNAQQWRALAALRRLMEDWQ